jgi:hypothetical protein
VRNGATQRHVSICDERIDLSGWESATAHSLTLRRWSDVTREYQAHQLAAGGGGGLTGMDRVGPKIDAVAVTLSSSGTHVPRGYQERPTQADPRTAR